MRLLLLLSLVLVGSTAARAAEPQADRGIAPTQIRGFGGGTITFRVYVQAPDEMLIFDLEPPADATGTVRLDVEVGLPGIRRVELATGHGVEALLPSGPAIPVPDTVVRILAKSGVVYTERLSDRQVRIAARGLEFAGGRTIDLAPRIVGLGVYPP